MIIKLSQLKDSITGKLDVFICSSSFEERCLSIPEQAAKLNIPSNIVFFVSDLDNKIDLNGTRLQSILGKSTKKYPLLINEPAKSLKVMNSALDEVLNNEKQQNLLLDITTFTHEGLLILFKLLHIRLKRNDKLILCYNGAKEYSYNETVLERKWLSKGVNTIRSILGYPGLLDPSKKNHLVVLFGFESERTKRLIDMFEYDLVSLAFGSKGASITKLHQQLNETRHENMLRYYPDAKKFEMSLINAEETKTKLLLYIKQFPGYNTVVVPMNNKISSIGAALAAINNPEIQLCYVTANQYNIDAYSIPSDDCYLIEVSLHEKDSVC
jgi:hypothetical protein